MVGNGAFAATGSAAGVTMRSGRAGLRVGGAVAYGVLAVFIYAIVMKLLGI